MSEARVPEAEEKIREQYRMVTLGRLMAGVVHEINTPIGSIFSNNEVLRRCVEGLTAQLAAQEQPPTAKATKMLDTMRQLLDVDKLACERIAAIVKSLKTYARVDESELRKVNLEELIRSTLKLAAGECKKGVRMVIDFPAGLPEVECYPPLIGQVVLNIVVNAAQAIEGEGLVTIRGVERGEAVEVSISDTGKGIPEEVRPRIFAAGFTTKPLGQGTGLGLNISRKIIVENHRGSIWFESETGHGTTFYFQIPFEQRRSEAGAQKENQQ